jgi:hypothetical protein
MRKTTFVLALVAAVLAPVMVAQGGFRYYEPRIWKAAPIHPGEEPWSACQRTFDYKATRVRPGPPGIVYCYVPYDYIYGPGEVHQNFNN